MNQRSADLIPWTPGDLLCNEAGNFHLFAEELMVADWDDHDADERYSNWIGVVKTVDAAIDRMMGEI